MEQKAESDPKSSRKPDRRVLRTRSVLADALIALILERGYERVTVQNIVDRANVGRTTFYAHFEDKQALLHHIFAGLDRLFGEEDSLDVLLHKMIEHAVEESAMFRSFIAAQTLREGLTQWLADLLKARMVGGREIDAQFLAGGIITTLHWWQTKQREISVDLLWQTIVRQIDAVRTV